MQEIDIVGGGPAGALCGEQLATAGFSVTLFDERLAWEKPCGGGLTHKAIEAYPFLLDNPYPKKLIHRAEMISSHGDRVQFSLGQPIVIYSRAVLNGMLLDRAVAAGCKAIHSRVTQVNTKGERVRLNTSGGEEHTADFVVLAAGARNSLLPATTPLRPADLEVTLGYFLPVQQDMIKVKFLKRFEGYLWSFPRADHLSVGICSKLQQSSSQQLRRYLDDFIQEENIPTENAQFYSHVLPSPELMTLRQRRIAGRNWALAGDAAACVDPITGEGLYYALRSGDLLAQAIADGSPETYPARMRAELSADLEFAARIAQKIFRGTFLGEAVTTRMVQFVRRSATFRALMRDLFSGAQDYRSLKRRLWAQLGITLTEFAKSLVEPQPSGNPAVDREPAQ